MKSVKSGKNKKAKIISLNATPVVVVNKMDKSPEKIHKETSANTPKPQITHDMIALHAWSIWMAKGRVAGQDEMNWHLAELELRVAKNKEKGDFCDTNKK